MRSSNQLRQTSVLVCIVLITLAATPGAALASNHVSITTSDKQVSPGETVTITYTIENTGSEGLNGPAIDVTELPDGWTITSHEDAGGTYKDSETQWLWLSLSAGSSKTTALTVSVPESASGSYEIPAEVLVDGSAVASTTATVTVGNADSITETTPQSTVAVSTGASEAPASTRDSEASVSVRDSGATAGASDQVGLEFSNVQADSEGAVSFDLVLENQADDAVNAPAIDLSVPSGWTVESHTDAGGTYRAADNQWVWLSMDGETSKTPSVTITPTEESLSSDDLTLSAAAVLDGETVATAEHSPDADDMDVDVEGTAEGATELNKENATETNATRDAENDDDSLGESVETGPGFGVTSLVAALSLFILVSRFRSRSR